MMQTVQLSIADGAMRPRSGKPWPAVAPGTSNPSTVPDPSQQCVLVLDEAAFARLPLPLSNPERVVLITRKDPQTAGRGLGGRHRFRGIGQRSISTVLLAIMAAALRVAKSTQLFRVEFPPVQLPTLRH